ncbi:MAG: WD40 repeat domain-containing protein, partial [Pseudomonadota bacterium]|nr:WD40 repeat domain-containing protein [Pseudomonadota bacterium]
KAGQAIYQWPIDTGVVLDVALSPDGQQVAASTGEIFGAGDNLIYLWDMHQGQLVQQLAGHHAAITHIEFNPLKPLLASASWDQSVRLWDLEQGEEIHKFTAHDDQVLSVAWHPQGEQLASGSADGMIYLWDQEGIKQTLEGHLAAVTSVAFSPYGHLLASGATDSSVRLWDLKQGLEVEKFQGHWAAISSVAFSPGGHLLASSSEEGSIRLWQLFSGRWQRVFINGSGDTWMSCVHSSCLRFDDGRLMTTHNAQNEIQAVLPPYRAGGELTLLEVPQKPLVVTEGQLQQFSLTVRNTGKQPLYWLTVQQQPPYQRLLLHAPETLGTLWPGETHTLSLAISGGADYQQPQQRLLTLKLDIHTAYTAPLSVEIPVDLQVSELSLDNIKLTGQQRQALAMHLTHHGQQGLPQIKLSAHLDNILLDTVNYPENPQEKTILAGQQQLNIVFPIPEHMNVTQHSRAQLRIRKPNYPPHVWLFPQQPIQLATLTWQTILFYTGTLAFILLLWHYGHLYYHPWIRRLTQKATPLTQFPVQQLPKLHAKLKGSGHLDAILTQNHLPAAVFDEAVLFMHMSAVVKAHILAQRLGGFCEDKGRLPSSYAHSGHYIQFTLPGVITCWFYFPEPKLAITQIFAHLHQYMRAHKVIIITFNHQHKQILRLYGYRLDWWKVPSEYELTAWLIGSEPQHIFYQILGDE